MKNLPKAGDIVKLYNYIDFDKGKFEVAKVFSEPSSYNPFCKVLVAKGLAQNNRKWKYTGFEIGLTDNVGNPILNKRKQNFIKFKKLSTTKFGYSVWKAVFSY